MKGKSKNADNSSNNRKTDVPVNKKSDLPVGKKSAGSNSPAPVSNQSPDPNVNMMNRFSRPASEMMGSHHDSVHGINAMRGHNHGGGANNGGKDGNLRFGNSALTKRRDVDGDMPGGSKGKK